MALMRKAALLVMAVTLNLTAAAPPNIVMIVSDDQGWGDFSFMGHPRIKTPNLDKLASQSLTFTHGYVPSSLCRPSLGAMITGLYPHQTKITSNDPPKDEQAAGEVKAKGKGKAKGAAKAANQAAKESPKFLKLREETQHFIDTQPTLPRLLGKQGYLSFQTGKWWEGNPENAGFTHGMTLGTRHGDAGLDIGRKTMQPMYDFVDQSVAAGKPFFLWYAPMMPHSPHNPPEVYLAKYKDKAPTEHIAKYWAMVDWFDETCGQLMGYLDKKGLAENTIVVFIIDNGWINEPNADKYAARSKQSQYDGGLRTPIMIRWPGKVAPRQDATPIISVDLAPTLLTAAGIKPVKEMTGINLLDDAVLRARESIYGEIFEHNAVDIQNPASSLKYQWTIRWPWKLILPRGKAQLAEHGPELYNLMDDPFEQKDHAADRADLVQQLTYLIDKQWKPELPAQ